MSSSDLENNSCEVRQHNNEDVFRYNVLFICPSSKENSELIKEISNSFTKVTLVDLLIYSRTHIITNFYDVIYYDMEIACENKYGFIHELFVSNSCNKLIVRQISNDETDRIVAMELGADDCLSRQCSIREITVRIRTGLRSSHHNNKDLNSNTLQSSDIITQDMKYSYWTLYESERVALSPSGFFVKISKSEYSILSALVLAPNNVLSREHLLNRIHHRDNKYDPRSLDTHISRLRNKLYKCEDSTTISTINGHGYRLDKSFKIK